MTHLEDIDSAPDGADAYLVKPNEMRELDVRVRNLIAARQRLRTHLFRRARKATGLSPSDLLRRARLECGARPLAAGNGTVADVAFTVGFHSVSHFCRSFTVQYGMTPATYRTTGVGVLAIGRT